MLFSKPHNLKARVVPGALSAGLLVCCSAPLHAGRTAGAVDSVKTRAPEPPAYNATSGIDVPVRADVNRNGVIDFPDLQRVMNAFGTRESGGSFDDEADINEDGLVNFQDLQIVLVYFGTAVSHASPLTLIPGDGFDGPTSQPNAVGASSRIGYDAQAIARWDVVPFQKFDGVFEIGVVAFHMNGIDRVEFSANGGPWLTVEEKTQNPRTGVWEYWAELDASQFEDGPIEVRAIVYPEAGVPRVLGGPIFQDGPYDTYIPAEGFARGEHSMFLHANAGGSLEGPVFYVRPAQPGVIEGNGSSENPFTRIVDAMTAITSNPSNEHGRVVLLAAGEYQFGPKPSGSQIHPAFADSYVMITAADGLEAEDVLIRCDAAVISPREARVHWRRVSFDSAHNRVEGTLPWFEDVLFFDSIGWTNGAALRPVVSEYYATGCHAEDKLYAFTGAAMVRDCSAERISGDVFQNSYFVLRSTVKNVDGAILPHHTDLMQFFGDAENLIYYDIIAEQLNQTQTLFLQPTHQATIGAPVYEMRDSAFVQISAFNVPVWQNGVNWGGTPWSQMQSRFNHVLFEDVQLPNQRFFLRDDMQTNQTWHAKNVIFRNPVLHHFTYDAYVNNEPPEGVTIVGAVMSAGDESPE